MAEFTNPIRTRTGGSVPIGSSPQRDISGTVSSVLEFGAEQVTEAKTQELSEEIGRQARDFIAQPERLNVIQETERELSQQREDRPDFQQSPTAKRLRTKLHRLRRAVDQGAASSAEVRMRANALTRQAISEVPSLAGEFIREANQTLGLFSPEIEVTDTALGGGDDSFQADLQERNIKAMQDGLADVGIFVQDPDRIREMATEYLVRPRFVESQLDALNNRNALTEEQARRMAPDVVQAASARTFTRMNQVLNSTELSTDQQVQELATIRLDERNRLSQRLNILGSEELNRRFDRIDRVIDKNIKALQGEFSVAEARNSLNALVAQGTARIIEESESARAMLFLNELGGDNLYARLVERGMGGIDKSVEEVINAIKGIPAGTHPDLPAETVRELEDELGVFSTYFETLAEKRGIVLDPERKQAFKNIVRTLQPSSDKEISEIPLKKWDTFLDIASTPEFVTAVESLDLSPEDTTKVVQRIVDYNTMVLEPNISEALAAPVNTGEGLFGTETEPSIPTVRFIRPEFNEESGSRRGSITFVFDESRLPEDTGGLARRRISDRVAEMNRIYAKRWNQSIRVQTRLSGKDPLAVSIRRWNDRFAKPQPREE